MSDEASNATAEAGVAREALRIETLSVFPEMFEPIMSTSIMGRARKAGVFTFAAHDLRDWTHDRHRTVDDAPFGGGQGMLMKCTPFFEALDSLCPEDDPACVVFFTPTGEPFTQRVAEELSRERRILFACSHYEGVDERAYARATRCISLGDYVLTGGELAALVVADAVVRLLPGALGDEMSAQDESFSACGLLEYAQYTRPSEVGGVRVPDVLLSGDHAAIARWRRADAIARTCARRPELIETAELTEREREVAAGVLSLVAKGADEHVLASFAFEELGRKPRRSRKLKAR